MRVVFGQDVRPDIAEGRQGEIVRCPSATVGVSPEMIDRFYAALLMGEVAIQELQVKIRTY